MQPCLEAIVYLTRYLNSEAVFLTATMPDFRELLQRYTLPDSRVIDLITDSSAFGNFAKCSFADGGVLSQESLLTFPDISSLESVADYYRKVFSERNEEFTKYAMAKYCSGMENIDFQTYAKVFSVIDDKNISLVVPQDAESRALIADCQRGFPNSRRLQKYTCSVSRADLEELQRQHVLENYDGIWCLTNEDYYDKRLGVLFSGQDYIV